MVILDHFYPVTTFSATHVYMLIICIFPNKDMYLGDFVVQKTGLCILPHLSEYKLSNIKTLVEIRGENHGFG